MPLPTCYVVPGFAGTTMSLNTWWEGTIDLWLNLGRLLRFGLFPLQLALDGVSPGLNQGGYAVFPGDPLPYYYGTLLQRLAVNFSVQPWGYDWRRDIFGSGQALGKHIAARVDPSPVYIVAHSMGGLVVRAALNYLAGLNLTGRVARVVNLGVPHYGSWDACTLLSHLNPTYRQLVRLITSENYYNLLSWRTLIPGSEAVSGFFAGQVAQVDSVIATFPALYQMFPFPSKEAVYGGAQATAAISAAQGFARGNTYLVPSLLTAGRAMEATLTPPVPYTVPAVNVVGTGQQTLEQLNWPWDITDPRSYVQDYAGDGAVPSWSATQPGVPTVSLECGHDALPYQPDLLNMLPQLLFQGSQDGTQLQEAQQEWFVSQIPA